MTLSVTCSWCHAKVEIEPRAGAVYCGNCLHRADVARMDCDCDACRSGRPRVIPDPLFEEEAYLSDLLYDAARERER